ncbi:MAG: hypothetical protein ACC648_06880 [Thiohalobacterales bacterium]
MLHTSSRRKTRIPNVIPGRDGSSGSGVWILTLWSLSAINKSG